jgi:hypothetical protein
VARARWWCTAVSPSAGRALVGRWRRCRRAALVLEADPLRICGVEEREFEYFSAVELRDDLFGEDAMATSEARGGGEEHSRAP